jgi:D-glycero-alpha-D-manno-heptose 1-phosphate guanylyltransferase
MQIKAIILAGGLGTRLKTITQDLPKPLANIAGRPFLAYLFDYLIQQGITEVVLAVSYQWEKIQEIFGHQYGNLKIHYSIEELPLGTGGAIHQAFQQYQLPRAVVLNGDTLFLINLADLLQWHDQHHSQFTMALAKQENTQRYGSVLFDQQHKVQKFLEKNTAVSSGWINGGIYLMESSIFNDINNKTFSLETRLIPQLLISQLISAYPSDSYFIDIGIPEDYQRAQDEVPQRLGKL